MKICEKFVGVWGKKDSCTKCTYLILIHPFSETVTMSFQQKQTRDEWIRKRWHTTIIFAIQTVIIGMDIGIAYVTLLLYVHEVSQNTENIGIFIKKSNFLSIFQVFLVIIW